MFTVTVNQRLRMISCPFAPASQKTNLKTSHLNFLMHFLQAVTLQSLHQITKEQCLKRILAQSVFR
jgi:hypothetical protein